MGHFCNHSAMRLVNVAELQHMWLRKIKFTSTPRYESYGRQKLMIGHAHVVIVNKHRKTKIVFSFLLPASSILIHAKYPSRRQPPAPSPSQQATLAFSPLIYTHRLPSGEIGWSFLNLTSHLYKRVPKSIRPSEGNNFLASKPSPPFPAVEKILQKICDDASSAPKTLHETKEKKVFGLQTLPQIPGCNLVEKSSRQRPFLEINDVWDRLANIELDCRRGSGVRIRLVTLQKSEG